MEPSICDLHSAIAANDYEEVASLIETGIDINVKHEYHTPLITAIYNGHASMVDLLLKHGADIELTSPYCALYPIHIAAEEGNLKIVKLLVEYGADINRNMSSGACAIHLAANKGHIHIIDYFLEIGVDIGVFSPNGSQLESAEDVYEITSRGWFKGDHHWIAKYNKQVAKYLFEKGAKVNQKDHTGKTILHIYACRGFLEMIEFLIEKGAYVEVYDGNKRTPLNLLLRYHDGASYIPIAKVLMKYMLLQSKKPEFSFSDYSIPDDYRHFRELSSFFNECKIEVNEMKKISFGDTTLSLLTLLQDIYDDDKLVVYLNNDIAEELHNIKHQINSFPIYSNVAVTVNDKIKSCKKRLDLMKRAFQELDSKLLPLLPYEIKQRIFSYLSSCNLINFLNAFNNNCSSWRE